MLAGARGRDDLLAMLRVRRREHQGLDIAIGEQLLVTVDEADALLAAEVRRLGRRAGRAGDEADALALALDARHEVASPGADADDRCANHEFGARVVIIANLIR